MSQTKKKKRLNICHYGIFCMRLSVLGMETTMSGFSMLQASAPLPPEQTGHLPPKGTAFLFRFLGPHSKPPPEKSGVVGDLAAFQLSLAIIFSTTQAMYCLSPSFTAQKNTPMCRSVFLFRMISSLNFPTLYRRDYSAFSSSMRSSSRVIRLCTTFLP